MVESEDFVLFGPHGRPQPARMEAARPLAAKLNFNSSSNNARKGGLEQEMKSIWQLFLDKKIQSSLQSVSLFIYFFVSEADAVFLEGARKIQS